MWRILALLAQWAPEWLVTPTLLVFELIQACWTHFRVLLVGAAIGVVGTHLFWSWLLMRRAMPKIKGLSPASGAHSARKHNRGRSVASWHLETSKLKGMKQEDYLRTQSSIEGTQGSMHDVKSNLAHLLERQTCSPSLCRAAMAAPSRARGSISVRSCTQTVSETSCMCQCAVVQRFFHSFAQLQRVRASICVTRAYVNLNRLDPWTLKT